MTKERSTVPWTQHPCPVVIENQIWGKWVGGGEKVCCVVCLLIVCWSNLSTDVTSSLSAVKTEPYLRLILQ